MGISETLQLQGWAAEPLGDRILLPLDGSGSAERILPTVRTLCARRTASVVLVRVIEPGTTSDTAFVRNSLRIAELYLKRAAGALPAKTVVRAGDVTQTILAVAAEEEASLIAISTHGRLSSEAMPYGPVADRLLRSSDLPVLAVPPHASAERGGHPERPVRTLLVPFLGSARAPELAPAAVDFAVAFGIDLAVLLCMVPRAFTGRGEAEELVDAEEHLRRLARPFKSKRIPTVPVVKEGDPVRAILSVALDHRADVLAMDAGGGAEVDSAARDVLRTSTVPVLLARQSAKTAVPEASPTALL